MEILRRMAKMVRKLLPTLNKIIVPAIPPPPRAALGGMVEIAWERPKEAPAVQVEMHLSLQSRIFLPRAALLLMGPRSEARAALPARLHQATQLRVPVLEEAQRIMFPEQTVPVPLP
jgi:hypothetical protein